MVKQLEIEIDGTRNEDLFFRPLQRSVRGRFDLLRVGEPQAKIKSVEWPEPIPSQRIGLDRDGVGYVREPLHDERFAPIKERIEKAGMKLEPELTVFENIDVPTWQFWLKRAVEDGIACVVKGELPDKIEGEPKLNFIVDRPKQSTTDRLANAIEKQSQLFEKLLSKLSEK